MGNLLTDIIGEWIAGGLREAIMAQIVSLFELINGRVGEVAANVGQTPEAWNRLLGRSPNCITWQPEDYRQMGAGDKIIQNPPKIDASVLKSYLIGCEPSSARTAVRPNAAVAFLVGAEADHLSARSPWFDAFNRVSETYESRAAIVIGSHRPTNSQVAPVENLFFVEVDLPESPLDLSAHLAAKLVLNNVSTASMGKLGRLVGNGMAHVDTTNKKLIDRGVRLVAEIADIDYRDACYSLFESIHEMAAWPEFQRKTTSPVAYTIRRLEETRKASDRK